MRDIREHNIDIHIKAIADGDVKAFSFVYRILFPRVFRTAQRFLKSESLAEDVTQEIFAKIWRHRDRLTEVKDFSAYFNTVCRNYLIDQFRVKNSRELMLYNLSQVNTETLLPGSDTVAHKELKQSIWKAMSLLPAKQKTVFKLSRIDGLRHDEIAHYMNISPGTVKKHLVTSLKFVRSYLASERGMNSILIVFFLLF